MANIYSLLAMCQALFSILYVYLLIQSSQITIHLQFSLLPVRKLWQKLSTNTAKI